MIETKEHYRQLLENIYNPDAPDAVDAVEELIEALREVAKAAKHLAARGYGEPNKSWQKNTLDRLDALPDWLINE